MYSRIIQDTPAELNYPRFDDKIEDLAIIDHVAVRKVDLFHIRNHTHCSRSASPRIRLSRLTRKSPRVLESSRAEQRVAQKDDVRPDETYLYVKAQPLQNLHLRDHYHIL
jgi:hypothetical protein